jgi:hypothetical protein
MESLDYWRLCDELGVIHAALLIVGVDPSSEEGAHCDGWKEHEQPKGYVAVKNAMIRAIAAGRLRATLRYAAESRYVAGIDSLHERGYWNAEDVRAIEDGAGESYVIGSVPDWRESSVSVDDLKTWLRSRGFTSGFFFPNEEAGRPGYMDPKNPRYPMKLAAAVSAWLAVEDPNGRSPKQALERWLREHAAEFGLTDDEGNPVNTAMEECSKVANWQPGGGASKTPG